MSESFEKAPSPIDPVESAKDAVMTAEQYAEIEHDRPYIFEVEGGDKKITFFGAGHSWDPDNPMFEQLREKFAETKPDLVLVEGFNGLAARKQQAIEAAKKDTEEKLIGDHGESGLGIKLAVENGIDFDSPEPELKDEYDFILEQGLSKDAVFAQQFFMMIPQWQQYADKGNFKEFADRVIEKIKRETQWEGFDYSYEHAEKLAHQFWGEGINTDDRKYYKEKTDPIPWPEKKPDEITDVNLVSRYSSLFRDRYIVGKIAEYLKTHDRIFIVYGASHAVMQEPALKKLMQAY